MTAQHFRLISEDEFNNLPFEQRMAYLQEVLRHIHEQTQETSRQIEQRNERLLFVYEKRHGR